MNSTNVVSKESSDQGLWKKKGFWRVEIIVAQGGTHFIQGEEKGGSNCNGTIVQWHNGLKQEGKTGIRRDNSLDLGVGENLLNEAAAHLST